MTARPIAVQLHDAPKAWRERPFYMAAVGVLTYDDLRTTMLRTAGWLRGKHGIGAGDRVGLCLPKSIEAVGLIYGILAAGAAYVPLQVQGPQDRLRGIAASLVPRLLITHPSMRRSFAAMPALPAVETVELAADGRGLQPLLAGSMPAAAPAPVGLDDLAAIYFTSGSTGEPKGLMWSHRTMAGAAAAFPFVTRMRQTDRLLSVAALHYAASAEIFFPLSVGACTYLASEREAMDPVHLRDVMLREGTTLWSSTATSLRLLVEGGKLEGHDLSAVRHVNFYGERMPMAALREAMRLLPQAEFVNIYAASEAFSIMTYQLPRPLPAEMDRLPLGRPTGVHRQSLRDEDGREVPPGEVGEICVIGPVVIAGYWKDPALSATRRLPGEPYSLRTGDLAWRDTAGNFHFAGRRDHLVKLRGHRFDLGEIEAALKAHPDVREAVAFITAVEDDRATMARPDAVVLAAARPGLETELRELCIRRLPGYALPERILVRADLPQLSSGKIDRRALQAMAAAPALSSSPGRH